jgi:hypothetical protein
VKKISQRTIVKLMEALEDLGSVLSDECAALDFSKFLYEHDFPDWFVQHAESHYAFGWKRILIDLRSTQFFYPSYSYGSDSITGEYLSTSDADGVGEILLQRLAALAATTAEGEPVRRSLELDGFQVDQEKLSLIPLEGVVSEKEEEDRLTTLIGQSGLPNTATILKHIKDAESLYLEGKEHASLNESRNSLQSLIDDISSETDRHGGHPVGLPGGTANRIEYLEKVGFLTPDEKTAFGSAWGALSAGSHPGVPAREETRIGLILALEFSQLLLLKVVNWKANLYKRFV